MPEWESDIEVDASLARKLIGEQFPSIDTAGLERLSEGFDYAIWLTADDIAFRFPRREVVIPGMRREMELLPPLSRQLPAAVPDARYQGVPTPDFPWPFFGSTFIPGRELTEANIPAARRAALAHDLGGFLRMLHSLPAPTGLTTVIDPNRRADMVIRVPRTQAMIDRISPHWPAAPQTEPILAAARRLPPDPRLVLSHGDVHLRQILVSEAGRLTGLVDWVDICLAPASVDLAPFWSLFSPREREAFLVAYGPVDHDTLARARVLALCLSAILAAYALDHGNELLLKETLAELDRALVDHPDEAWPEGQDRRLLDRSP